jgi:hypothetical protein
MKRACAVVIALSLTVLPCLSARAQVPETLRGMAAGTRYARFISELTPAEVDRRLTSSEFHVDDQAFLAAYYFVDELDRDRLTRLHLLKIAASGAITRRDMEPQGSVLGVIAGERVSLLGLHRTPSAGGIVVLDSDLRAVMTLDGYSPRLLANDIVLFKGNMVHFAPFHQESLWTYEPGMQRSVQMFPGSERSPFEVAALQALRNRVATVPASIKGELERSNYGVPDDLDRSLPLVRAAPGGQSVAAWVKYGNYAVEHTDPLLVDVGLERRLRDGSRPLYQVTTVVRCDRQSAGVWSCRERLLDEAAREFNVAVPIRSEENWQIHEAAIESILDRELTKR